jgi:hypothetical protein
VTKHLVLDLNQVARVEEATSLEPRRPDALGMAVQRTLLLQSLGLGIALAQSGVLLDIGVMYYTPLDGRCKDDCGSSVCVLYMY